MSECSYLPERDGTSEHYVGGQKVAFSAAVGISRCSDGRRARACVQVPCTADVGHGYICNSNYKSYVKGQGSTKMSLEWEE